MTRNYSKFMQDYRELQEECNPAPTTIFLSQNAHLCPKWTQGAFWAKEIALSATEHEQ